MKAGASVLCVLVVVVLLQHGAHAEKQVCIIPAEVQPTSAVQVGGTITSPLAANVTSTKQAAFAGAFAVVFPTDKCPTAATLAADLAKAYLATPKNSVGVTMTNTSAAVTIGDTTVANLAINGLTGTVLSKAGASGVAAPVVTATGGLVSTFNTIFKVAPFPLTNQTMNLSTSGCTLAASKQNTQVVFSCPKLQVDNKISLQMGSGSLKLTGSMTAIGNVKDGKLVAAGSVPPPMQ